MKKRVLQGFLSLAAAAMVSAASAAEIKVMYPSEGDVIPPVKNTFVFGNINPSTGALLINGQKVTVYKNGGFIAYVPVTEGDFEFKCELSGGATATYVRKIRIKEPPKPRTGNGGLWLDAQTPAADIVLFPGDILNVQAAGTSGKSAVFSIEGVAKDIPMMEFPSASGRYYGTYRVKDQDLARNSALSIRFKTGIFAASAAAKARGRISISDSLSVLETSTDTVILRNGIDSGYMMFLPKGVKLVSDGRAGNIRRIRLSDTETGWVDDSKVMLSTDSYLPPQTETGAIKLRKTDNGAVAAIALYDKVPYIIEERENSLRIYLYYTKLHTNWVVYDSSDTFIQQVRFLQTGENTATVDLELDPARPLWGYDVYYASGALQVEMRTPLQPSGVWPAPLAGLKVVVDAGHSPKQTPPYDGAIGPMGTFEYQVNLLTAQKLRDALSALGASVYMTRSDSETVPLMDRPRLARDYKGDLFISLHNNAIPDGEDPFSKPRGFSVYHYHRHSFGLAKAIHAGYLKNMPLPDEGLRFGDYAVARMTYMPAVLIESAYMILPEQEELLNASAFQQKIADTVAQAVLDYFRIHPKPPAAKPKKTRNR